MKDVNAIAKYYKRHKVATSRVEYCERNNADKCFTLHKTIDIRWTPSTFRSLMSIFVNWNLIAGHLDEISKNENRFFDDDTNKKGSAILEEWFLDKNFLALLALGQLLKS